MFKITPNPPFVANTTFDPQSVDRALAYHNCAAPGSMADPASGPPDELENLREEMLVRACSILDSAAATAYESADSLTGSNRKVAMGVVHLIELVQQLLDRLLDEHPNGPA